MHCTCWRWGRCRQGGLAQGRVFALPVLQPPWALSCAIIIEPIGPSWSLRMAVGCQGLRKIGAGGLEVCSDGKRSKSQPQVHLACWAGVRESGTRAGRGWLPAQINDHLIGGCILGLWGEKKKIGSSCHLSRRRRRQEGHTWHRPSPKSGRCSSPRSCCLGGAAGTDRAVGRAELCGAVNEILGESRAWHSLRHRPRACHRALSPAMAISVAAPRNVVRGDR